MAANCHLIVSGDNDLLSVTGYKDIEIINPNEFVKKYLKIEKLQLPQKSRMNFFITEDICGCVSNYVLLKIEEQPADTNLIFCL